MPHELLALRVREQGLWLPHFDDTLVAVHHPVERGYEASTGRGVYVLRLP